MRDPQDEIFSSKRGTDVIQMERTGKNIIMRIAHNGEPLQEVGSYKMSDMKDSVLLGLFICSHDSDKIETAKVWNVRIDKPIANNYYPNPNVAANIPPNKDVLGSRLETMNVFTGERKVVYESAGKFEAPNWMPGGKQLLFNENGLLYKISINGGTPEKFNTGSIDKNNNDHGISFNGKMLAISSSKAGGGSAIYIVPISGGEPKLITEKTPSYFHGWNPDNKEIVFVAQRDSSKIYNLYKIPVNGETEIPLTKNTAGHVDGPEYSPDGKYIYYNANPTGTMQIWRMKTDGSGKEQITFDEYHNWFPHISPDGKWISFISFMPDIDPDSHPSYKRVMLRLMPVAGGAPRVIAYLYGGQGTLNAPSWSPDSKSIAFVSNSEKKEE
jgi:Tol biopolymer transport system component